MRAWLGVGGLALVVVLEACRGVRAPGPDDLDTLAAVVDEAKALAPVARALCGVAGSAECAEVTEVVDRGLDAAAPILDAARGCQDEACKAPQREEAKRALPKAKRARDTARRLAKRPAPAGSASAAPAASGAP